MNMEKSHVLRVIKSTQMVGTKKQYLYQVEKNCEYCQKLFVTRKRGKKTARYCSHHCASIITNSLPIVQKALRSLKAVRIEKKCLICPKTFIVCKNQKENSKKRFCGRSCSAKWRTKQPWAIENSRKAIKIAQKSRVGVKNPKASLRMIEMNKNLEFNKKKWEGFYRWHQENPTFLNRGGNGQLTKPQIILMELLNLPTEYPIETRNVRHLFPSLPNSYKVDLAHLESKTAIEVDGESHKTKKWKFLDKRKTKALDSLGWSVLRFWNKEILENPQEVVDQINSYITLRLREIIITSQIMS